MENSLIFIIQKLFVIVAYRWILILTKVYFFNKTLANL